MEEQIKITAIIPAYNEEARLPGTIAALRKFSFPLQIVVVDDGSTDRTVTIAKELADEVLVTGKNQGKGYAVDLAWRQVPGEILLFVDADLEDSAERLEALIPPLIENTADMTIAAFPPASKRGGFGLVKGLARNGIKCLTGQTFASPLSGQRGIRRTLLEAIGGFPKGWGIEAALTIDALRKGFRIQEVFIQLTHREMGRGFKGFMHRGEQLLQISQTLFKKWLEK